MRAPVRGADQRVPPRGRDGLGEGRHQRDDASGRCRHIDGCPEVVSGQRAVVTPAVSVEVGIAATIEIDVAVATDLSVSR